MSYKKLFTKADFLYESTAEELTEIEKNSVDYLEKRILNDIESKKLEIVAFIGANGSGKSTALKDILEKLDSENKIHYAPFEVWQESNENEVWKDFIIAIMSKIRGKTKKKIAKKIDNGYLRWWYWIIAIVLVLIPSIFYFFPININGYTLNIGSLIFSIFGLIGISVLLQKLLSVGNINHIFQYEEEFKKILEEHGTPVVVLVEDVDRTEHGKKVLEVLHTFLNTYRGGSKRSLIVICPIPRDSFYGASAKNIKNFENLKTLETSCKIYDYAIWSGLRSRVTENDITTILKSAGCTNASLVNVLLKLVNIADAEKSLSNTRAIKFILRDVDQFVQRYPKLDPCVATLFIATKYVSLKVSSVSFENSNDIKVALLHGTSRLFHNRQSTVAELIGIVFDVGQKIKWTNLQNGIKKPVQIDFEYTRDEEPHIVEEAVVDSKDILKIHLSGHYKELL